jgi:hypothetical protein
MVKENKVKLSRLEKKQKKLDAKKEKFNLKHSAAPKQRKAGKHISSLSLVGSKVVTSLSGFAAAGTFYQYEIMHNTHAAMIYGGATVVTSVLGAAPYIRSVKRTNKTLAAVSGAMDKIDAGIGTQKQAISDVLTAMQTKHEESIKSLHAKIDDVKKSIDTHNGTVHSAEKSEASSSGVHVAPQKTTKNITVE